MAQPYLPRLWVRDWGSSRAFTLPSHSTSTSAIHPRRTLKHLLPVWNFPQHHRTFAGLSTLHTWRRFCVESLRYEVLRQNLKDPSCSVIAPKSALYGVISISESLPLQWGKKKYPIGLLSWAADYKRLNELFTDSEVNTPDISHGLSEDGWFLWHQPPKSQFCRDTLWWLEKEANVETRKGFGRCHSAPVEL